MLKKALATPAGFEPATVGLEGLGRIPIFQGLQRVFV